MIDSIPSEALGVASFELLHGFKVVPFGDTSGSFCDEICESHKLPYFLDVKPKNSVFCSQAHPSGLV